MTKRQKVRLWLIKKLGGEKMSPRIFPIAAEVTLGWDYIVKLRPTWLENHIKKQLAEQIVEKILEDEALYTIETKNVIGMPATTYRLRMCVVCDRKGSVRDDGKVYRCRFAFKESE